MLAQTMFLLFLSALPMETGRDIHYDVFLVHHMTLLNYGIMLDLSVKVRLHLKNWSVAGKRMKFIQVYISN